MKENAFTGARVVLGAIFLIFGTNGLLMIVSGKGLIPMPPPSPEMGQVMGGFFGAKYLMPSVKLIQVVSGVLLLSNKFIPLAITLLAPIVYNIIGLHLFIDPSGLPMAIVLGVLMGMMFSKHRESFQSLLRK